MNQNNIDLPVGGLDLWAQLREAREARGWSIGDISAHLKLAPRQIEAIESGDLSALPGLAFARGFVRNYARLLGLDPAEYVAAVDAGAAPEAAPLAIQMASPSLGKMPSGRSVRFPAASLLPIIAVVLALFVLISLGKYYRWFESRDEDLLAQVDSSGAMADASAVAAQSTAVVAGQSGGAPEQSAASVAQSATASAAASAPLAQSPVAAAQASAPVVAAVSAPAVSSQSAPQAVRQSAPALAAQSPAAALPAAASAPAAAGMAHLGLAFDDDSWVEVRDATGKLLFSRLNKAGAVQEVQGGTPPYSLTVGNASKVHLTWQGKPVDLAPYTKVNVAKLKLQ